MPFETERTAAHEQPKHSIRLANSEDKLLLANILSDSFRHDPVVRWILPSNEFDERFFLIDVGYAYLGYQHCWISSNETSDGSGCACWLPPGAKALKAPLLETLRVLVPMLVKFGLRAAKRGSAIDQTFQRYRPKEPHYYLHMLGARYAQQGRGVGSALLKESLQVVDQQRMPAYLESSNEANVTLYERYGFKVENEAKLDGDGPRVWFMRREIAG